jgi:hypothetical protein
VLVACATAREGREVETVRIEQDAAASPAVVVLDAGDVPVVPAMVESVVHADASARPLGRREWKDIVVSVGGTVQVATPNVRSYSPTGHCADVLPDANGQSFSITGLRVGTDVVLFVFAHRQETYEIHVVP